MDNNLLALAIIPGILIIVYVYKKDRVEKEPIGVILKLVVLGALSCIPAGIFEAMEESVLPSYPEGTIEYALITAFAMAAFTEEIVKYLALRIGSWRSRAFNYRFDGVVYGVSAAVGFAIFENIGYVSQYGLDTAIVRAFTAVPLHAFCGVFMGTFYAYSKKASIMGESAFKYTLLSLIVPMIIHGIYDTMAFMGNGAITYAFLGFVVLLYIVAISTIKKLSAADYRSGFYPEPRYIAYDQDI